MLGAVCRGFFGPADAEARRPRTAASRMLRAPAVADASALGCGHDEVVAVDDLVAALVAEQRRDVLRVRTFDLVAIRGRVADEAARDLRAVRADEHDAVADLEAPFDGAHAGRQQAPLRLQHRALGAGVEMERAG